MNAALAAKQQQLFDIEAKVEALQEQLESTQVRHGSQRCVRGRWGMCRWDTLDPAVCVWVGWDGTRVRTSDW